MKKVLAIVLVMLMALSLFACGNGNVGQQASNSVDEVKDTGLVRSTGKRNRRRGL